MQQEGVRWEIDVQCPFYRHVRLQAREVVCESGLAEGAVSAFRFATDEGLRKHLRRVCCSLTGCESCPNYKAAMKKY